MRLANSVSSLLTVFLHRKLFPGVILLNKLPHVHPLVKSLSTKYFPTTPLVGTFSFQQGKKNFDLRPWDFINYEDIQNSFCFNSIPSLNQQKSQNSNTNNIKRNQGATWGHHESRSCIIGVSEQYDSGKKKKRKLRRDCPVINLHCLKYMQEENNFLCKIGLKDFSVPLNKQSRKYIRFVWLRNFYEFLLKYLIVLLRDLNIFV